MALPLPHLFLIAMLTTGSMVANSKAIQNNTIGSMVVNSKAIQNNTAGSMVANSKAIQNNTVGSMVVNSKAIQNNTAGSMVANSKAIQNNTAGCSSFRCGHLEIRYPFWTDAGDDTNSRCGYPSLRLDCRGGNTPLLRLPSGQYAVTSILYGDTTEENRTLSLLDLDVFSHDGLYNDCPNIVGQNLTLPSGLPPPLSLTARDTNLTFFINCSFKGIPSQRIDCLESADGWHHTYVFRESAMPYDYAQLCQDIVVLPVLQTALVNSTDAVDAIAPGLNAGFELSWGQAAGGLCGDCEDAGGLCGQIREAPGKGWSFSCFRTVTTDPVYPHADASTLGFKRLIYAALFILTTICMY